jgi:hypothetical protein
MTRTSGQNAEVIRTGAFFNVSTLIKVLLVWMLLIAVTAMSSGIAWGTLLSCALTVAVLSLVVLTVAAAGWHAVLIVFLIYFGITWINTLDEAVLFQILPVSTALRSLIAGAAISFTVAMLLVWVLNRWSSLTKTPNAIALTGTVWKTWLAAS